MVNIKQIPNEVLSHISKRFSGVSKNASIQHEAYKEQYRDIKLNKQEGAGPLLLEVIQNPRCGEYIQHADFENCIEDARVPLDEDTSKILTKTLIQRLCISLIELSYWVQQATLGNQGIIIAILLVLLPRLETLIIPSTRYCESIIQEAVQRSRGSIFRQPKPPLSRLKIVIIGNNEMDPAKPGQFIVDHGIKICQGLTSLKTLSCNFRTLRALDDPSITLQLYKGSTSLHVFDLELSAEDLEIILQHIKNVTDFTYITRRISSQVRNLDETLQTYAGDSLKDLLLQCIPTPSLEIPNHGFTSLKGFTVLKKVTIALDTIRTLWNRSSSRPTYSEFPPASVEKITLVGPKTTGLAFASES